MFSSALLWRHGSEPLSLGIINDGFVTTSASAGTGINDLGNVVGYSGSFGFVWDETTGMRRLSVPEGGPVQAIDINNRDEIVGVVVVDTFRAFLWRHLAVERDAFTVEAENALQITAPGVLANDGGEDLLAELVLQPTHGSVELAPNGSFTYRPAWGFIGLDSFAYRAKSGTAVSEPVTVSITVVPATPQPCVLGCGAGDSPPPGATPELDSLVLFGSSLSGMAADPARRHRGRGNRP
jgi:hypothetical protein